MNKPQVLVFIDWYKPHFKAGGPVRSLVNLVDHLHDQVDFHIVTGDRDYTDTLSPAALATDRWTIQDNDESVWYASSRGQTRTTWNKLLKDQRWDVVYINGLYSKWSTIVPLWLLRASSQRRLVAVRGMLAAGPMRQGALKKRAFLAAMKAMGCFNGVEFQATNAEEVRDIERWIGCRAKIHLAPNLARKPDGKGPLPMAKERGALRLVSAARIAEEKNTLFAIERLRAVKGAVRFDLYGTVYDQGYWGRCQQAIAALPPNVTVTWHGQLENEQVLPVLGDHHALFMPSVGENFGHALVEAFSVGRPVLTSERTPWKDLEQQKAGWDLPLERPDRFTAAIQDLVDMDQAAYDLWSAGAYALGVRYLNDPVPVEQSLRLFQP
ncbi:MAG: glycosyltransferase [Flavobacteriales bacterium]